MSFLGSMSFASELSVRAEDFPLAGEAERLPLAAVPVAEDFPVLPGSFLLASNSRSKSSARVSMSPFASEKRPSPNASFGWVNFENLVSSSSGSSTFVMIKVRLSEEVGIASIIRGEFPESKPTS